MEIVLTVAKVLALIAVSALCVYLIVVLSKLKETAAAVSTTLRDLTAHTTPVLNNVSSITAKVDHIVDAVDEQIDVVKESVSTLKSAADNLVAFEQDIQNRVEGPIRETVSVVRAVSKGVKTFVERVRS